MVRRIAVCLVSLCFALWALASLPGQGWARPGGGQSYRAPTRTYSPPPRTYTPPSHTYVPPTTTYVPRSYDTTRPYNNTTYVQTGGGGGGNGFVLAMILIVAIILFIIWLRNRNKTPERATISVDQQLQRQGLSALRRNDPAFDPAAFVERTKAVVARVNEAWLKGDMSPARRVISDGVFVRFKTQLGLLKADGLRNVMVDWRVVAADILGANADALWDTVHVKIVGEARDADVPLSLSDADARKKAGSSRLSQYQEVWSFVRRRGKHSKAGVPALQGQCPNCGAEMPLSEVVKCDYCQAIVNSGEHDWVLAEITQPEEWRAEPAVGDIDGLADLRARDPSISRQELEDRASVAFWKWIEARRTGKTDKLARFCVNPPTDADAATALGLQISKLSQVAVGSAELVLVESGPDLDQAVVEIRWSASVDGAEPETQQHALTLARSPAAKSKRGLSSLDCPVCGGQLANSDDVTCSYCGATLSGGKHEWSLLGVTREEVPEPDGEVS
jgi:hypothetical protein